MLGVSKGCEDAKWGGGWTGDMMGLADNVQVYPGLELKCAGVEGWDSVVGKVPPWRFQASIEG